MTDLRTERLVLHPVDTDEAARIVAGRPAPGDAWAPDFPFAGDVVGATMFRRATVAPGEQRPFGHDVVVRAAEAVRALADLARRHGVTRLVADTDHDNLASRRTPANAGFARTGTTGDLVDVALDLRGRSVVGRTG